MRYLSTLFLLLAAAVFTGCGDGGTTPGGGSGGGQTNNGNGGGFTPPESGDFSIDYSFSPSPMANAAERLSDFCLHFRQAGENAFTTLDATSVESPASSQVVARFSLSVPEPVTGVIIEYYYSYSLDGVEQKRPLQRSLLRGRPEDFARLRALNAAGGKTDG